MQMDKDKAQIIAETLDGFGEDLKRAARSMKAGDIDGAIVDVTIIEAKIDGLAKRIESLTDD